MNIPCFGQNSGPGCNDKYPDPERFEKEIQCFEAQDRKQPLPQEAIVCTGSSSMGGWHEHIKDDLAPLSIIPRGFGGSIMNDLFYYADRIVISYKPRAVVVYEGDNDVAAGIAPKEITGIFLAFVKKVNEELPATRIYFLSVKPSIARWNLWPALKEVNRLIAAECAKDKQLTFVDVVSGMLNGKGNPRREFFLEDNLHMTRDGYVAWRNALRPVLIKAELQFESKQKGSGL